MIRWWLVGFMFFIILNTLPCNASNGDTSETFTVCRANCYSANCSTAEKQEIFYNQHTLLLKLLQWNCVQECEYQCMWPTVDDFITKFNVVPKFFGKWPFIRVFGSQEIASSLASLLNLCSHIYMIRIFRKKVTSNTKMYYLWNVTSIIGVNTWFWSFVFHMRDTSITEKMDYFCALTAVMYNLFLFIYRTTLQNFILHLLVGSIMLIYFSYHVYYLSFVKFDYGYNMRVNVAIGVSNALGWLSWYVAVRKVQPYAYKCALCIVITLMLMMLEIWDFPPIFWLFDAHSFWHFGTAPIALLWYRFAIDDCSYLYKKKHTKIFTD